MKTILSFLTMTVLTLAAATGLAKSAHRRPASNVDWKKVDCTLKAGVGPFTKFTWETTGDGQRMKVRWAKGVHTNGKDDLIVDSISAVKADTIGELSDFEFQSWASGEVYRAEDDEGKFATVFLVSDGPATSGYYRCKGN